jgi:hypothetical protein
MTRARLEIDRQEFEDVRFSHEQEVIESRMMQGGNEVDQLRQMLRDVKAKLRDSEEGANAKTRMLEKRGVELNSLREQLGLSQEENAQLEGDVRQVTRQAAKKTEQGQSPPVRRHFQARQVCGRVGVWFLRCFSSTRRCAAPVGSWSVPVPVSTMIARTTTINSPVCPTNLTLSSWYISQGDAQPIAARFAVVAAAGGESTRDAGGREPEAACSPARLAKGAVLSDVEE